MVYKSPRIVTMRNTVWFTNILIKKEEHFFDMRTIVVQNKILCIGLFGGVKVLANTRNRDYLALQRDGGNSIIKTHQSSNIDNWSHSGCRSQSTGLGPDEITVCAGVPRGSEIFCLLPQIPKGYSFYFMGFTASLM